MDTLDDYLARLASDQPVPGGGSAAALVAAMAAGLVAMVSRIRSRSSDELTSRADRLRDELGDARLRDEAAFAAVIAAQALPKADETQRSTRREALDDALQRAAEEPLRAAGLALDVLKCALALAETDTGALASDVGCAAEFAFAAIAGCAHNVRINHRYMRDASAIAVQNATLVTYESEAATILSRVRPIVAAALKKP